jgi:hypothetical protein
MSKALFITGGILNLLFGLFHLLLGYQLAHLPAAAVRPDLKGLMAAFNLVGTLLIFFFAYASLVERRTLWEARLGRSVLLLAAMVYLSRAAEEFVLFHFNAVVFFSCLGVGALYFGLWLGAARAATRAGKAALAARA